MNTGVMFSKKSDLWRTPLSVFEPLNREFGFTLDFAASDGDLCGRWLGPGSSLAEDALSVDAQILSPYERIWCNPPYSACYDFVEALAEKIPSSLAVMLLPARTDTKWWHAFIWDRTTHKPYPGVEVRFIKGRIKFESDDVMIPNSAPFPSVVVVFG